MRFRQNSKVMDRIGIHQFKKEIGGNCHINFKAV